MNYSLRESGRYPPIRVYLNSETADFAPTTADGRQNRGDLLFNLRQDIAIPNDCVMFASLDDMLIANSEYNIHENNQNLYVTQDVNTFNVSIDIGNYTVDTLTTALNTAFEDANLDIRVEFNTLNNKFRFKIDPAPVDEFMFVGDGPNASTNPNSMMESLGFEFEEEYTSVGGVLDSAKQCDLSGVNSFFFCTNLQTSNYNFMQKNQGRTCNILQKIQIQADTTGINFFENTNNSKTRVNERHLSYLHVSLLDEDFYPWNPYSKWSATISLYFFDIISTPPNT